MEENGNERLREEGRYKAPTGGFVIYKTGQTDSGDLKHDCYNYLFPAIFSAAIENMVAIRNPRNPAKDWATVYDDRGEAVFRPENVRYLPSDNFKELLAAFPGVMAPDKLAEMKKEKGFSGLMEHLGVAISGLLHDANGREYKWELTESRKKEHGLCWGLHLVLILNGGGLSHSETPGELISQMMGIARDIAMKAAVRVNPIPGSWKISLNGPGLVNRDWVHFHIVVPTVFDTINYAVDRGLEEFISWVVYVGMQKELGHKPALVSSSVYEKIKKILAAVKPDENIRV